MRHLVVSVSLAAAGIAQSGAQPYWLIQSPSVSPSPRHAHSMAFDSTRRVVVLFGGWVNQYLADTWEWNGTAWAQRSPAASPSARGYYSMIHDSVRQRTVLFGGWNGSYLGDTWEWDGTTWAQRAPAASPVPRSHHAMTYDSARQRTVLFGGGNGASLGDTWEWDGNTWTQRPSAASPPARLLSAMTFDVARGRTVLHGGLNGNTTFGDTWEWDGSNWLAGFSATYPPARYGHSMAFDGARQQTVIFGGSSATAGLLGDTWAWDGNTWIQIASTTSPQARELHAMAFDDSRQQIILFGGRNGSGNFVETWANGNAGATEYGSGCGTPALGLSRDQAVRPVLGQACTATIVNCPTTTLTSVAMGWSDQQFGPFALPVPLDSIGMTGCILWQSADVLGLGVAPLTPTTMSFSFAIPNQAALIGFHAYIQAYAFAPGQNALQLISSNGIDWRVGSF